MTDEAATPTTIPVLDMSLLDEGEDGAETFRTALRTATHEVGFFYLGATASPTR